MTLVEMIVGRTILGCELDEAAVDYARGDYAKCLVELAQCAVVIIAHLSGGTPSAPSDCSQEAGNA